MSAGTQCTAYCSLNRFYSCDGVPTGHPGDVVKSRKKHKYQLEIRLRRTDSLVAIENIMGGR